MNSEIFSASANVTLLVMKVRQNSPKYISVLINFIPFLNRVHNSKTFVPKMTTDRVETKKYLF